MQPERVALIPERDAPALHGVTWTPCIAGLLCTITVSVVVLFAAYDVILITGYLANEHAPRAGLANPVAPNASAASVASAAGVVAEHAAKHLLHGLHHSARAGNHSMH